MARDAASEIPALRAELARMQVMVMRYAQVVLEQRLPTSPEDERQKIPSDVATLQKAINVAMMQQDASAQDSHAPLTEVKSCHNIAMPAMTNGHSAAPSPPVQHELAQLRMHVERLNVQCRAQEEELSAARSILAAIGGLSAKARASLSDVRRRGEGVARPEVPRASREAVRRAARGDRNTAR